MNGTPALSVVTAVRNGERYLVSSLQSILTQTSVDLELIVVDDGSTDGTAAILADIARRDTRTRVIRQHAAGLTSALIVGCNNARGALIARHDADDVSMPGRLAAQARMLNDDPGLSMVSCWGLGIGPRGETLFEITRPADSREASAALERQAAGPAGHGSVMFRADAYRRVGGYREAFRFAQDWDLWLRLIEIGRIAYAPEFLYAYRVDEHSISAARRDQQQQLVTLARRCHEARRRGESEQQWLSKAAAIGTTPVRATRRTISAGSYFLGKCLLDRRDRRALHYLGRSIRTYPLQPRAWVAYGLATFCTR